MAFTVSFAKTTKKRNSTKSVTATNNFSCELIAPCSAYSPVIRLHHANPTGWNYCHIAEFGLSYFIDDWEYNDTCWLARCSIDALGTFRSDILASNAYALYSDSDGNNKIVDTRISARYDQNYTRLASTPAFWAGGFSDYYILRTIGVGGSVGGYVLSQPSFDGFINSIGGALTFDTTLQVQMSDAIGCIIGAMHFPIAPYADSSGGNIHLGDYDTGVFAFNALMLTSGTVYLTWTRPKYDWRSAAFCDYTLWLPFVGGVSISSSDIGDSDELIVDYTVDWAAGGVLYKVYVGSALIGTFSGLIGNSIPVTGYMGNALGAVSGALDAAGSAAGAIGAAATGNVAGAISGAVGAAASAAGAAIAYKKKTASMVGGTTACAYAGSDASNISLTVIESLSSDEPNNIKTVLGLPAFKKVYVGGCSGYLQTAGFSCAGNAPAYIKDIINNNMDMGVFIE